MSTADEDLVAFAKARLGSVLRGKYRLDEVVGYGGMAVVFRATHRNQAELAVKILHPKLARVNGVRERFLREGYAANSVKHKGAVLVVDDDVDDDGSTFLVMELLHGQSCELIWQRRGGTFPLKSALTVAHDALDVLASAHTRGIVHRDIKPANLFVTKEGALKVLDFGIAKVLDAVSAQATGRLPIGTPAFMSPEQALGESNQVGPKTDIWAMGATLFSLLSGELVHDAPTAHEILVKTATQKPRSLATASPFLAKEIIELVDRSLCVDPAERWASAAEMRDAAARIHRHIFREPPSNAGLLELYGGDDIDTANAADETVKQSAPPKMSTPPPANDKMRSSAGKIRASPWLAERKTAPRLSLVIDESSGIAPPAPTPPAAPSSSGKHGPITPRSGAVRPVIPPPTSANPNPVLRPSQPGAVAYPPPSSGQSLAAPVGPGSQPDVRAVPNKTARMDGILLTPPASPADFGADTSPRMWPRQANITTQPSTTRPRSGAPNALLAVLLALAVVAAAAVAGYWVTVHRNATTLPQRK